MNQDSTGIPNLRRKRRRHPALLRTHDGVEEIIPGLSTWTAEDLMEAGAWDEELAELTDMQVPDDMDVLEVDDED
mgnify:CR=1 FL=1